MNDAISAPKDEFDAPAPPRSTEAKTLLRIAAPLSAAYLADFTMGLTTKAIVGRLGYEELASIGLANDLAWNVVIVCFGVLSVVGVLVAQAEGGGRRADAGLAARHGLMLAAALSVPAAAIVLYLDQVLTLTGQQPEVLRLMGPYLGGLAWALPPLLCFFALRSFVAALARTAAVMVITIIAVGLNYLLCLGLVEGAFGLPALGVAGAGWAKAIVSLFMLAALVAYAYLTPALRGYGLFRGRLKIDGELFREILRLGAPVAGIVVLEAGLFAAVSIFSGQLGAAPLAGYQIIASWIGLAFMLARGLAEAGMVRVAYGIGQRRRAAARQSGLLTMSMGLAMLAALTVVPLSFPETLVALFLERDDPGFEAVLTLTSRLFILVAFFQVFDGLQVMAALALRGLKDTITPLWLAAIGYWVFGVLGGWILAFPMGLGADGLWWGMAAGLTITGSLLAGRFWLLTRP